MRNRILCILAVTAAGIICLAAQQDSAPLMSDTVAGYHLATSVPLPDAGSWDYLGIDEPNHQVFVSHSDEVLVNSTETNQVVGKLAPTPGNHGVVISRKDGHGFTSNSGNSSGQQTPCIRLPPNSARHLRLTRTLPLPGRVSAAGR